MNLRVIWRPSKRLTIREMVVRSGKRPHCASCGRTILWYEPLIRLELPHGAGNLSFHKACTREFADELVSRFCEGGGVK